MISAWLTLQECENRLSETHMSVVKNLWKYQLFFPLSMPHASRWESVTNKSCVITQENNIVKHTPSEICCAAYIVLVPASFSCALVWSMHSTDKTFIISEDSQLIQIRFLKIPFFYWWKKKKKSDFVKNINQVNIGRWTLCFRSCLCSCSN